MSAPASDAGAADRLRAALAVPDPSARVQAALAAGTFPNDAYVATLVARFADEPDFSVRETLTWALTRHDPHRAVDALLPELASDSARARSQALHTLSKIGDPRAWPAVTPDMLDDPEPAVARAAWRVASTLAPADDRPALAERLAAHLGRGDWGIQRSLTEAFVRLGDAADDVIAGASASEDPAVRAHALATRTMMSDPEATFDDAIEDALRRLSMG